VLLVLRVSLRRLALFVAGAAACCLLLPAWLLSRLPPTDPARPAPPVASMAERPVTTAPPAAVRPQPSAAVPAAGQAEAEPTPAATQGSPAAPVKPLAKPSPLASEIALAAAQSHLPPELIQAVIAAESAGDAHAVSPAGAQGLMQLMPPTARSLGVRNAFDPRENVVAGSRYLADLLAYYERQQADCLRTGVHSDSDSGVGACPSPLIEALAAYNAGPGAVDRYGGLPPYPETQRYIARVLDAFANYARQ